MTARSIVSLAFLTLSSLVSLICLIITAYSVLRVKKLKIRKHIRIIAIFSISCYLVSAISYIFGDITIASIHWKGLPYDIVSMVWIFGSISSYIFFMELVRTTFDGTAYNSRLCSFILLYILLFMYIGCQTVIVILHNDSIERIIFLIELLLYIILSLSLLIMFIKKLMLLTVSVAEDLNVKSPPLSPKNKIISHHSPFSMTQPQLAGLDVSMSANTMNTSINYNNNNNNNNNNKIAHKYQSTFHQLSMIHLIGQQTEWLNIITKLTILLIFGEIGTDIWLIYHVITHIFITNNSIHLVSGILISIDIIINSIVIVLSFSFSSKYYKKCCGCIEVQCNKKCLKITKRPTIKTWTGHKIEKSIHLFSLQQKKKSIHDIGIRYTQLSDIVDLNQ